MSARKPQRTRTLLNDGSNIKWGPRVGKPAPGAGDAGDVATRCAKHYARVLRTRVAHAYVHRSRTAVARR